MIQSIMPIITQARPDDENFDLDSIKQTLAAQFEQEVNTQKQEETNKYGSFMMDIQDMINHDYNDKDAAKFDEVVDDTIKNASVLRNDEPDDTVS